MDIIQTIIDRARHEPLVIRGFIALLVIVAGAVGLEGITTETVVAVLGALGFTVVTARRKVTPVADLKGH